MLTPLFIGNKISQVRKSKNLSQAQLAELLFISPQAVGKWERGESMPDIVTLSRLAEILDVNLNYFSKNSPSLPRNSSPGEQLEDQSTENPPEKQSWDMSRSNWVDADFSGLKNLHEKFSSSNMQRCKFNGSDLSGLVLKTNNVTGCDFSNSDISNSQIQGSHFADNVFKDCVLKEAIFSASYFDSCDFSKTHFIGTQFSQSYLSSCDLSGADLSGVVFKSSGLAGKEKPRNEEPYTIQDAVWNRTTFHTSQIADVVFIGAFKDCYFENCKFTRVTFQKATLENVFFKNNKKLKRVQFIDCRADRITYEFLKQGNADLSGITVATFENENT